MSHTRFNEAVKLRLDNHLDDAADTGFRLWSEGYRTPWLALLNGNIALDCGEYEFACRWHEIAFEMIITENGKVKPEAAGYFQDIVLPYAYDRMRLGVWDEVTWDLWEAGRLNRSWHPAPGTRRWDGSPEKLLILSEGGYGDVFLMTRLFQKLDPLQRAASRFVVGPQMKGLKGFKTNWDGIETAYHDDIVDWSSFRFSTALMSLLSLTGIRSPADIPQADSSGINGYANWPRGEARWYHPHPRYHPPKKNLFGLCWTAEELGVQKRIRSIDRTEDLEPLSDWDFINLCPGKSFGPHDSAMPCLTEIPLTTWTDTARAIAALDAVVTVDTAVGHLAGLLGVPTLMILPLQSDWKYLLDRTDCFWWHSVRLIRNTSPYTFLPAIEKAAELLEKM